jgi:hypothetical protein
MLAPVTPEGQIVCICYATIGIPLFLMCIANLSGTLGDMFRFVYAKVCCRLCLRKKRPSPAPSTPSLAGEANKAETKFGKNVTSKDGTVDTISNKSDSKAPVPGDKTPAPGDKTPEGDNLPLATEPNVIEEEEEEEDERVTVPLTITMIIITIYILIGAVLFNFFEGWGYVASGYFCYITLATIGNATFNNMKNKKNLILNS